MLSKEHKKIKLIHRSDFVEWVLKPTPESERYWSAFIAENPSEKQELEHARFLIKGISHEEKTLSDEDESILWNRIRQTDHARTKKLRRLKRWAMAAGILLIISISGWWFSSDTKLKTVPINYQSLAVAKPLGNEVTLIRSDRTEKTFTAKDVELKYNQQGKLETKNGKQVQTEEFNTAEMDQVNQVVVPRGKRSTIVLADGTRLWLNSGSRAIYPVVFNGGTREIYIEGEGYLEVAHDPSKPFYVVTDHLKVKVLGTKFDISAYSEDDHVSVVLVEGSVQASTISEKLIMTPHQLMNYRKSTHESTLEKTDVQEYVSWKDGWMLCNQEKIQSILKKLARYYDVTISCADIRLNDMTLTGKLDLKNSCEEVLKVICATAPVNYRISDHSIILTIKD